MINTIIIQSSKQAHGQHIMNRFCVICDKFVPSYLRMTWSSDEGGYCCRQCAINDGLIDQDDE